MDELSALRVLYETTRQLGIGEDLDAVLDEILRHAHDLIGFDHCALLLYDAESEDLVLRRVHGFRDELVGMRIKRGQGLSGWVAAHREAIREGDVASNPRYIRGLEGAQSNMVVPLIVQNRLVGVINVESRRRDAFSEQHEMLLTMLGTNAALAILASQAQTDLQDEIGRLDALYRISALSWLQKSFGEVVRQVLEETQRVLPAGEIAILLLDAEQRHLVVHASRGYDTRVKGMRIPLEKGVSGRCVVSGEIQLVDDVHEDPDYLPGVPGARSQLALPLAVEDRVIGVLSAESTEVGTYDRSHVRFLSAIARQVAVVLHTSRLQQEAQRLAISDPLTDLFNRRYFQQRLETDMSRAARYGEPLALAFFDLDDFKSINDHYGHPVGDEALIAVGRELKTCARTSDLVARMGGEEFAVLLLQASEPGSRAACERIRGRIAELQIPVPSEGPLRLTTSVGVALFPQHGQDYTTLFSAADEALYQAKHGGRNRVVVLGQSPNTGRQRSE